MPRDRTYTYPPELLDAIDRVVAPVAKDALRAKGVAYDCRETLIVLCGRDGQNGRCRQRAKEMDRMAKQLEEQRRLVQRVIYAALGTTGCATAIAQVVIAIMR